MNWREYIVSDPMILRGKPCVKGTRIPAALILGYIAAGRSIEEICVEFPDLTRDGVVACIKYASDLVDFDAAA